MNSKQEGFSNNRQRAAQFMAAMGRYDITALRTMYNKNSRFWQMGEGLALSGYHDLDEVMISLPGIYRRLPDGVKYNIFSTIEEGNVVMLEAESFGMLDDGAPYRNQHHSAVYFSDNGDIIEYRDYLDTLHLYETIFGNEVASNESNKKQHCTSVLSSITSLFKYISLKSVAKYIMSSDKSDQGTLERNKVHALQFVDAIGKQDLVTLASLYSRKGVFWQIGSKLELAGNHSQIETAKFVPSIYKRFPSGMTFNNITVVAENNKVAIESISKADLYNGTAYNNQYNFIFYFDDKGRVTKFKEYWGTLHAYERLFEGRTHLFLL